MRQDPPCPHHDRPKKGKCGRPFAERPGGRSGQAVLQGAGAIVTGAHGLKGLLNDGACRRV